MIHFKFVPTRKGGHVHVAVFATTNQIEDPSGFSHQRAGDLVMSEPEWNALSQGLDWALTDSNVTATIAELPR